MESRSYRLLAKMKAVPLGTPQGGGVRALSKKSRAGCLAGGNVKAT